MESVKFVTSGVKMVSMARRTGQSTARWILTAAVLTGVVVAGGLGVWRWVRPVVVVSRVVEGPVVHAFYATGTISPVTDEYPVRSHVAGTIEEVRVGKGDAVKAGDVLAVVSDPGLAYALDKAKAELEEKVKRADEKTSPVLGEVDAKISAGKDILEIAQREEKRVSGLVESNAASQTDLDRALDRVKQAWSEYEALKSQRASKKLELEREVKVGEAAVKTAQWNFDEQTVRSPIDGVVLDRPTPLKTRVAVNDHLMQVADVRPSKLVMRAQVDEEDKAMVGMGQVVRMTLYSFAGQVFEGKVTRIYHKADPDRRTFEVDVTPGVENPKLALGMTGELAFILEEKERALVVPAQAVQGGILWTVRGGRLEKAAGVVGIRSVERAEVVSGMGVGDVVVISPVAELREGQGVREEMMDPEAAAGLNRPKARQGAFKGFN